MDISNTIARQLRLYEDCADILKDLQSSVKIDRIELSFPNSDMAVEQILSDGFADSTPGGILRNAKTALGIIHYGNKYMEYLQKHAEYLPKEETHRKPIGFTQ